MKALSIHQPFASAIIEGVKKVENRTWGYLSLTGQTIAIHATSKRWNPGLLEKSQIRKLWPKCHDPKSFKLGCILGTVRIRAILGVDDPAVRNDPWSTGPKCWLLTAPLKLRKPIYCAGKKGLWTLPDSIEWKMTRSDWPTPKRPKCSCESGKQVCCLVSTDLGLVQGCRDCRPKGKPIF